MTEFYFSNPHKLLRALHTELGERAVYDSVAHCTRCGCCQQACPSLLIKKQETFSPRGRNQMIRLLMEGKLNAHTHRLLLEEVINSCTLCGRCIQACAGKIPTAEHILELRRRLNLRALPALLHRLLTLRTVAPVWFSRLVRAGLLARRTGIVKLLRLTGITRLKGLSWINRADDLLPAQTPELKKYLLNQKLSLESHNPTLVYLPSMEAEFLMPHIAADVLKLSAKKYRMQIWPNQSSGLFEYIYGDLRKSRLAVRRLIRRHEQTGRLPLLTDSADVFIFLHRAAQLFSGNKRWEEKARRFSQRILFVTDIMPKKPFSSAAKTPVRLDYSALFCREGEPFESAHKILKTLFKKNFVECLYTDADTPAFGYGFVRSNLAQEMALQTVRSIAQTQAATVFTLSGLSALELNYWLKRFYPYAKADHVICSHG